MIIKSCFTEHSLATISALEYVIHKYGNCSWFNGNLKKIMLDMHIIPKHESFRKPLIIFHDNGQMLGYSGYHYIIHEIERRNRLFNTSLVKLHAIRLFTAMSLITLLFCLIFSVKKVSQTVIIDGQGGKHGVPEQN